MKVFFLYLILSFCLGINVHGQTASQFKVEQINVTVKQERKSPRDFKVASSAFYEDDKFIVNENCQGEFGGSLIFKDKKTGLQYGCSSTCPVVINKLNRKYIVTNSLAHMSGSTEILEIEDPKKLDKIIPAKKKRKNVDLIPAGESESKSKTGTKVVLKNLGTLALASFPYDGKIYHVITDFEKTSLAEISNGKFVNIINIKKSDIYSNDLRLLKTADGHFVLFYESEKEKGYLDIFENIIKDYSFK